MCDAICLSTPASKSAQDDPPHQSLIIGIDAQITSSPASNGWIGHPNRGVHTPIPDLPPLTDAVALTSTLYYLQWHRSEPTVDTQASDLFHEFHHDPPASLTEREFDRLYEEMTEVNTDDLEHLYRAWNRGSGRESEQFHDLRYCERCESYIEGGGEAVTHAAQNHGYDALSDPDEPEYVHGVRSLSVGDIVERDDEYYACAPIGWREIDIVEGDP